MQDNNKTNPLISVCLITYNHEKYLEQCLESVVAQKGLASFEIVIGDDNSTDNTPVIIEKYRNKYPELVRIISSKKNVGMLKNWEQTLQSCKGKYIALLEGDDFWNDENKLFKQFQILESRPDCSISFTNANVKVEIGKERFPQYVSLTGEIYSITDLIKENFIPTCSVLFRNNISNNFFPAAYFKSPYADWIVHILNARLGNIHFLNERTCTYRLHGLGIWGSTNEEQRLKNLLLSINCIYEFITDKALRPYITTSKKIVLQKICAFYKKRGSYIKYLIYRIQLHTSN